MSVRRVYVEKKQKYNTLAHRLKREFSDFLNIKGLETVRVLIRYDIENISDEIYKASLNQVFADRLVEDLYEEEFDFKENDKVFLVTSLAGQYDQKADTITESLKLFAADDVFVETAMVYVISGQVSDDDFDKIKDYTINLVDSKEVSLDKKETIKRTYDKAKFDKDVLDGFIESDDMDLEKIYKDLNLAMTLKDLAHIKAYFKNDEKRNPTMTEIRVFDTYWSDHCRHTTFSTELTNIDFEEGYYTNVIKDAYNEYLDHREVLYKGKDKDITLMDIAVLAMKKLRAEGKLDDMEVSDEINACSIIVPVDVDGKDEEWLIFFKNETHNHPTEIEPFGGAATCLGGAIRDPLSGRGYVYQAMRITGAADPRVEFDKTLEGKLAQRVICKVAAEGYSSYGNQIGIAAGYLNEVYHPNFVAKRMELGAVMGAAPRENVKREDSLPGDKIILLGGRTGRDGIGGATGSSKVQTSESIETCGAEVQKGNAPMERKIQRLFRKAKVSKLIKKCNDFGAGGVSVAIGELADGLIIDLDKVPAKYQGLTGTELAISESQERMAIVVDEKDVDTLLEYAKEENLEATLVAKVTEEERLIILWQGQEIVNVSRAFLNTNGAHQEAKAIVTIPKKEESYFASSKEVTDVKARWLDLLSDLNVCSQKGLSEMFDNSVGGLTTKMAYGGKYQMTPIQTMVAKVPVLEGETNSVTMMSYGYDPYLSSWSPFHGSIYAVISSVAKIVAAGGDYSKIRLSFQEFFKRLGSDAKRWGEPLAALLGAYNAQVNLELPSIGGKDSMSGTYHEIDVPPTLVSFAVNVEKANNIVSPELKEAGNVLVGFNLAKDEFDMPDYKQVKSLYSNIYEMIKDKKVFSSYALTMGGIVEAISKMAFGNGLGVELVNNISEKDLFAPSYGSMILEIDKETYKDLESYGFKESDYTLIGQVIKDQIFKYKESVISLEEGIKAWTDTLEEVYPTKVSEDLSKMQNDIKDIKVYKREKIYIGKEKHKKPTVFAPIFLGTTGEYEQIRAFKEAGANVKSLVFNQTNLAGIKESIDEFSRAIDESQILLLTSGFTFENDALGTGKYLSSLFANDKLRDAVNRLLEERDGLALGLGHGFNVLMKLGLLLDDNKDTALTTNLIGRHVSKMVYTKVISNKSPWYSSAEFDKIYTSPISTVEGRFVTSKETFNKLIENGQIASMYVDLQGNPSMAVDFNPVSSMYAIEAITSADGRVLGKTTNPDRMGKSVAINIYGEKEMNLFKAGVDYFA